MHDHFYRRFRDFPDSIVQLSNYVAIVREALIAYAVWEKKTVEESLCEMVTRFAVRAGVEDRYSPSGGFKCSAAKLPCLEMAKDHSTRFNEFPEVIRNLCEDDGIVNAVAARYVRGEISTVQDAICEMVKGMAKRHVDMRETIFDFRRRTG